MEKYSTLDGDSAIEAKFDATGADAFVEKNDPDTKVWLFQTSQGGRDLIEKVTMYFVTNSWGKKEYVVLEYVVLADELEPEEPRRGLEVFLQLEDIPSAQLW